MSYLREKYPDFFKCLDSGDLEISYRPKFREFVIHCRDGYAGVILQYCPWSGQAFPLPLRDEWFDLLEEIGIDPEVDKVPEEFQSERWWKDRGL